MLDLLTYATYVNTSNCHKNIRIQTNPCSLGRSFLRVVSDTKNSCVDSPPRRCAGKYPVEWVYPPDEPRESQIPAISDRVTVDKEVVPGVNPRPYLAHLTLENLQFTDTDRYDRLLQCDP